MKAWLNSDIDDYKEKAQFKNQIKREVQFNS